LWNRWTDRPRCVIRLSSRAFSLEGIVTHTSVLHVHNSTLHMHGILHQIRFLFSVIRSALFV